PLERGQQTAVLGDVVRRDADRLGEFLDERSVALLDPDAEAGRPRIAARAAVDVGEERRRLARVVEGNHATRAAPTDRPQAPRPERPPVPARSTARAGSCRTARSTRCGGPC